jgi:hypothetical protein
MQVKIQVNTDGSRVIDIVNASVAEVQQLISHTPTKKNVVETTSDAIISGTDKTSVAPKKYRRRATNLLWTIDDIEFIARMSLQLGPDAKAPSKTIANALKGRGNARTFGTLNAMAYNVYRYLRDGKQAKSLTNKSVTELNSLGYTAGMMRPATRTNFLGEVEVRHLPVHSA